MVNNQETEPIPQPRWLVIYIMHMECDAIFNQFQHQPETEEEWALLHWANRTVAVLPLLEDEFEWPEDIRIPAFFNYCEHMCDVTYGLLHEMVK